MSELKAIQTEYKGYLFRSRLEARWAVFLDSLGVKWEYEPEGYDLGNGMCFPTSGFTMLQSITVFSRGIAPYTSRLRGR